MENIVKIATAITLILMPLWSSAQNLQLQIDKRDGSSVQLSLDNFEMISFNASELILSQKTGQTQNLDFSTIRRIVFSALSDVNSTSELNTSLRVYPNPATDYISIQGLNTPGIISIHSSNGTELVRLEWKNESSKIDIKQLPRGVYIIKTDNGILKFVKL